MTLIILAGVWALAFGNISLTHSFKMKGNEARVFGALLIAVAAYGMPYLNGWLSPYMPKFFASNEALRTTYDMLIAAFAVYATGWVMTRVFPRLKIPTLTVSFKRQRA